MRQKAVRARIRILGESYGPRLVGLHNRFRARTDRYVRYLDFRRDEHLSRVPYQGLFIPGRDRHRIYLRPGVDELTVAHELMHGILWTEGFVGLRVPREDLRRYPALAALGGRLGDLLVHPVLLQRLRRSRFDVDREEILRGARTVLQFARPDPPVPDEEPAARCLALFSRAALLAEALHRHAPFRASLEELTAASEPETLRMALELAREAPWDPDRTGLRYRVRIGRLLALLDDEARRLGFELALRDRMLLSPFLTAARLEAPAHRFFEVQTRHSFPLQPDRSALHLRFRLDGTCCALRFYPGPAEAARARAFFAGRLASMTAGEFLESSRIDAVIIERRGKARIRMVDAAAALPAAGS